MSELTIMKYCKECGVYVNETLLNCPLCGSFGKNVNRASSAHTARGHGGDGAKGTAVRAAAGGAGSTAGEALDADGAAAEAFTRYSQTIEPFVAYPKIDLNRLQKKSAAAHFLIISFLSVLVCIVVNILQTPASLWSPYVAAAWLQNYFSVLRPLLKKNKIYNQLIINLLSISVFLTFIDFFTTGYSGFSLKYVIPSMCFAAVLVSDVFIVINRGHSRDYYLTLMIASLFGLVPKILMWSVGLSDPILFGFVLFLAIIVNYFIIYLFFGKNIREELAKKFYI
jgi:hypothetical protein